MTRILAQSMPKPIGGMKACPPFNIHCRFKVMRGLFTTDRYYDTDIVSLSEVQQVVDGRKKAAQFKVEFTHGGKLVFEETNQAKIGILRSLIARNAL